MLFLSHPSTFPFSFFLLFVFSLLCLLYLFILLLALSYSFALLFLSSLYPHFSYIPSSKLSSSSNKILIGLTISMLWSTTNWILTFCSFAQYFLQMPFNETYAQTLIDNINFIDDTNSNINDERPLDPLTTLWGKYGHPTNSTNSTSSPS